MQFVVWMLDPAVPHKAYTINPEGTNLLLFQGTEGRESIHKVIHFEPVKYIYAILYYFIKNTTILFVFSAMIILLPLLYLTIVHPLDSKPSRQFVALSSILFATYPSILTASSYDLRPYIFLSPLFSITMLSIIFNRSIFERILFFNLLCMIREEALIIGIFILLYVYFTTSTSYRKKDVLPLAWSWAFWFVANIMFFVWTGYRNIFPETVHKVVELISRETLFVVGSCAFVILLVASAFRFGGRLFIKQMSITRLTLFTYCLVFIPLILLLFSAERDMILAGDVWKMLHLVFSYRFSLIFSALWIFTILIWNQSRNRLQKSMRIFLVSWIALSMLYTLYSPIGLAKLVPTYQHDAKEAEKVFEMRGKTDKRETWILCDYHTHQVFYDYVHSYIYQRLPWSIIPNKNERYYPANKKVLAELIKHKVNYIVISTLSLKDIQGLLLDCGVNVTEVFRDSKYLAFSIKQQHR